MTQAEEPLRNIEYVRCPECFGARIILLLGGVRHQCKRCKGWGCVALPEAPEERIALGLRALRPSSTIELTPKPKKRLRLPLHKRRRVSGT